MSSPEETARTPTRPPLPTADAPTPAEGAPTQRVEAGSSAFEATVIGGSTHARPAGPRVPDRLGPYQLLEEIGRGGMGIVFRARHVTLGTECAVKVLIAGEHASEESIARFQREAAGVARLGKHPNIVHVFDLGWEGPLAYYAMELIEGRSLRQVLRERLLEVREAAGLMERVARALHFAHEHGLFHRDVKPNNILLRADGEPQVVDFGLARDAGSAKSISVTGDIMGTPEYMSPEQADGRVGETDARTDVYAAGAVLYECLTGIPPHRGETWAELLQEIQSGEVVPPRSLRSGLPSDIETVVMKCLEVRREARYATAEALADDIARFRNGEPVHARPVSAIERLRRRAVRSWRILVPTSVAVLLALSMGGWYLYAATRDRGALAHALEMGRKYRREDRAQMARDMYQEVRRIDPGNSEATEGVSWADRRLAAIAAEAEAEKRRADEAEALLDKSRKVHRVLARWGRLYRTLRDMECSMFDANGIEDIRARNRGGWEEVERFLAETPDDSASRATARALAGWARRIAGYESEGIELMQAAARLDDDVPYGALMEALVRFVKPVEMYPLPEITAGASGVVIGPAPDVPPELHADLDRIPALLDRARQARVLGEEGAEGFAVAIEAMTAMREDDYRRAIGLFDDALGRPELRVFESALLAARGKACYLERDFDGAIRDLEEVVSDRPGHVTSLTVLGEAYYARSVQDLVEGKDPIPHVEEAIDAFTRAVERHPAGHAALNDRGNAWLVLGDAQEERGEAPDDAYRRGIADFEEVLRRVPDLGIAHANYGNALVRTAELDEERGGDGRELMREAIDEYGRAIELAPAYALSLLNRGHARTALAEAERKRGGDAKAGLGEAEADFGRFIEKAPDNPAGLVGQAAVWSERGNVEDAGGRDPRPTLRKAMELLDRALELRPTYVIALRSRARECRRLGAEEARRGGEFEAVFRKGIADMDELVRLTPQKPSPYEGRAILLLEFANARTQRGQDGRGEVRAAIQDYEEALRAGGKRGGYLTQLARAWSRLAHVEREQGGDPAAALMTAIARFEEALREKGAPTRAWFDLGVAGQQLADTLTSRGQDPGEARQASIVAFAEAARLAPRDAESREGLGEALRRAAMDDLGSGKDAIPMIERAVAELDAAADLAPDELLYVVNRAMVRELLARQRAARGDDVWELFRRAVKDAEAAVQLAPDHPFALFALGEAWAGLAREARVRGEDPREAGEKALATYARALEAAPDLVDPRISRGGVYEALGNLVDAEKEYEAVLAVRADDTFATERLAVVKERLAFADRPAWMRDRLEGDIALRSREYREARFYFERALAEAGTDAGRDETERSLLGAVRYNLACLVSLRSAGRVRPEDLPRPIAPEDAARLRDEAFDHLAKAVELGFVHPTAPDDPDLVPLHEDPRWKAILDRLTTGGK